MYQNLELISHHLCPYVQRSVITLSEKSIEHTRTYIDLSNKPSWFLALSATGKVPVLRVDEKTVLFESAVICEFLDEVTPGSLHPQDPLLKAEHRAWNEFASGILNTIGSLYNAMDSETYYSLTKTLAEKFNRLEEKIQTPFFAGEKFSMVDAAYGPVFRYFDTMDPFLPFDIFTHTPKVRTWRTALAERPSIISAVSSDYPALLETFLLNRMSYISSLIQASVKN